MLWGLRAKGTSGRTSGRCEGCSPRACPTQPRMFLAFDLRRNRSSCFVVGARIANDADRRRARGLGLGHRPRRRHSSGRRTARDPADDVRPTGRHADSCPGGQRNVAGRRLGSTARLDPAAPLDAVLRDEADAIDVERGPVLRATVVSATQGRSLVLTAASVCLDGASIVALARDIVASDRVPGVEEPLQYADYAEWRHQLLEEEGTELEAARSWWQDGSASAPRLLFARPDTEPGGALTDTGRAHGR